MAIEKWARTVRRTGVPKDYRARYRTGEFGRVAEQAASLAVGRTVDGLDGRTSLGETVSWGLQLSEFCFWCVSMESSYVQSLLLVDLWKCFTSTMIVLDSPRIYVF